MTCPSRLSCCSLILAALVCASGIVQGQTPDAKSNRTGSIAGRVTVGAKGASGITVGAFGGDIYPRRAAVQTTTDSEGRYRLFGLAAGSYQVTTLAPTLVTGASNNSPYGSGKMILLAASESVEDVDFKLTRGAVITGRVTDEDGKPVIEERINLELVMPFGGPNVQMSPQYLNGPMYQTDDRGIYRIYGLLPGRFKVSVGNENVSFSGSSGRGAFAQTFYGDTNDGAKAVVVELGEGTEATNIDIRLGHRAATFSVAGRVINSENGEPVAGVRPTYGRISKANSGSGSFFGGLPTNPRGEFRFDGLEPGHYTIYVSSRFDGGDFYSDPIVFDVADRDVTDLELKALRGLTLSGVVVVEGDSNKNLLAQLGRLTITAGVRTTANPPTNSSGATTVGADGSFRITGLAPGKASLFIYSAENPNSRRFPPTRVEADGVDQTQGLDLLTGHSVSNLRVIISYGTGVIRGAVKFENGSPPPEARMYVAIKRDGRPLERGITTDARGHFVITDIPPGNYEVNLNLGFYAPALQSPQNLRQPLKQFVTVADDTEVEVNFTVDLKPKEGGP